MSYTERNRTRITVTIIGLLLLVVLAGIFLQKRVFHTVVEVQGSVYPTDIFVGDTLFYRDKNPFSAVREWKFGDGGISVTDSGYYLYKTPGYYQISLTLNGQYSKTFPIQVRSKPVGSIEDSITTIEAPAQANQFENIVFRANSKTAKLFSWKFGESGSIDAKEPMVIYAYKNPGEYTVTLFTDEVGYPITHKIKILPSFKVLNDSISVDDMYSKIDNDFKFHLQKIANGEDFNLHYNYLLDKYLCKNENTAIKVNTSKINTFYYYCTGLQFDKNSIIQSVKVSFNENMNCVTKIDIIQEKNESN
ncbi:MAG: PKD domain-containing protein [Chitinophagaceae bacterium]|jgi:hypothetical protein|nr:PKD domain-containing protein [Chitinophagaceae bacterium]